MRSGMVLRPRRAVLKSAERPLRRRVVAARAHLREPRRAGAPHRFVDDRGADRLVLVLGECVDADDDLLTALDGLLEA